MFDFSTVSEVKLSQGSHASPAEGMCLMEMVAWFAGEPHSAAPACACPVLAAFCMGINDWIDDPETRDRLLKPLVGLLIGTRGTLQDQARRSDFLAIWARGLSGCHPVTDRPVGPFSEAELPDVEREMRESAMESAAIASQLCVQLAGWGYAVEGIKKAILLGANEQALPQAKAHARHGRLRRFVKARLA